MTGKQQENFGYELLMAGILILSTDGLIGLWWIALYGPLGGPPQFLFLGLAVAGTFVLVGGLMMVHGQSRKFRGE